MLVFNFSSVRTKSQKSKNSKAIWIFTNDENPCKGNCVADKGALFTLAKDIRDNGIKIQLWALPTDKQNFVFDKSVFFDDLISCGKTKGNLYQDNISTCFYKVNDMLNNINVQAGLPRKYQTVPLFLPDWDTHMNDPCIMMDLYALVHIKRKPTPILVHQDTFKYVNTFFRLSSSLYLRC